jgi:hypothetical protein
MGALNYNVVLDLVAIFVALGAAFYLYKISGVLKGGVLGRGVRIIALTPIIIALSTSLELLWQLGVDPAYGTFHDIVRLVFLIVLLVGARSVVMGWRKLQ